MRMCERERASDNVPSTRGAVGSRPTHALLGHCSDCWADDAEEGEEESAASQNDARGSHDGGQILWPQVIVLGPQRRVAGDVTAVHSV